MASSISKKRLRSGQVLRLAARGERVGEFALIDGSHLTPPPESIVGSTGTLTVLATATCTLCMAECSSAKLS